MVGRYRSNYYLCIRDCEIAVSLANIEKSTFGENEFDWIFAVLGDPFNTKDAWRNISKALKKNAYVVFVVPSFEWATKFRSDDFQEKANLARFLTSEGRTVFLPSFILEPHLQKKMIESADLALVSIEHVLVGDAPYLRSPKISEVLSKHQNLLDIYIAKKQ